MSTEQRIGWGFPGNATKPHYFYNDIVSLCWMFRGVLDSPLDPGRASDCTPCRRKLAKLKLRRTGENIETTP